MAFTLRPYQTGLVDQTRLMMQRGVRSILLQAPTGSGKTAMTAFMLGAAASKGKRSLFCVHRRELVKQSIHAFEDEGIPHGIIAAGFPEDSRQLVQVCSIQSLARRISRVAQPDLIVFDETHHVAAKSWEAVYNTWPSAFKIGLTATPERLDGKGLSKYFQEMLLGPSVRTLIDQGYLSKYRIFAPPGIRVDGVATRMGDFAQDELAEAADKPTITGDAIREYKKLAHGKKAVVFCCSVEHSKHVASQFMDAGIPAAHVDGETPTEQRDLTVSEFSSGGRLLVLCNVDLFGEGFDLPALEVSILLRPTQSLGLFLQQVGRALRPSPNKRDAIILDHAGNTERHGLPDEDREWSLEGKAGRLKKGEQKVKIRTCKICFAAQPPFRKTCQFCGAAFEVEPRQVEEVEGELKEIDIERARLMKKREQGGAQTLEDLVALGKQRGYTRPYLWAKHVWNARQSRKVRGF